MNQKQLPYTNYWPNIMSLLVVEVGLLHVKLLDKNTPPPPKIGVSKSPPGIGLNNFFLYRQLQFRQLGPISGWKIVTFLATRSD